MKVAVIGATGQLGRDLCDIFKSYEVLPLTQKDIEITDASRVEEVFKNIKPHILINTAAYHDVEKCEENPDIAFWVNSTAVKKLALICKNSSIRFIHISTDYVFDGKKNNFYLESDSPNPVNIYGASKYVGEIFIRNICDKYYIFRIASLFGKFPPEGKEQNFIEKIITKAKNKEDIRVINDIMMSPTYARDAGLKFKEVIERDLPSGIYHVTNSGSCSWFEFAEEIVKLLNLKVKIKPLTSERVKRKAQIPLFSALKSEKLAQFGIKSLRDWKESLKEYLSEKGHLK